MFQTDKNHCNNCGSHTRRLSKIRQNKTLVGLWKQWGGGRLNGQLSKLKKNKRLKFIQENIADKDTVLPANKRRRINSEISSIHNSIWDKRYSRNNVFIAS